MKNTDDPKKILLDILAIVGYEKDKEMYVNSFYTLCANRTLYEALERLPKEKKEKFQLEFEQGENEQRKLEILKKYISDKEYTELLEEATSFTIQEFIQTLLPHLTKAQEEKLNNYIHDVG